MQFLLHMCSRRLYRCDQNTFIIFGTKIDSDLDIYSYLDVRANSVYPLAALVAIFQNGRQYITFSHIPAHIIMTFIFFVLNSKIYIKVTWLRLKYCFIQMYVT